MNLSYKDTQLKLIGSNVLSCLGSLQIKRVHSYPFVVRVFQMGEWISSFRVLEPRNRLEIMNNYT